MFALKVLLPPKFGFSCIGNLKISLAKFQLKIS